MLKVLLCWAAWERHPPHWGRSMSATSGELARGWGRAEMLKGIASCSLYETDMLFQPQGAQVSNFMNYTFACNPVAGVKYYVA